MNVMGFSRKRPFVITIFSAVLLFILLIGSFSMSSGSVNTCLSIQSPSLSWIEEMGITSKILGYSEAGTSEVFYQFLDGIASSHYRYALLCDIDYWSEFQSQTPFGYWNTNLWDITPTLVCCFDPNGTVIWNHSQTVNQGKGGLYYSNGSLFVTASTPFDWRTAGASIYKYNGLTGEKIWSYNWSKLISDQGTGEDIFIDDNGDVYMVGWNIPANYYDSRDVIILKLDGASGALVWSKVWGSPLFEELGLTGVLAHNQSLFVAGYSQPMYDVATLDSFLIQLNSSTGMLLKTFSVSDEEVDDIITDLEYDFDSGKLYTIGSEGSGGLVRKIDPFADTIEWNTTLFQSGRRTMGIKGGLKDQNSLFILVDYVSQINQPSFGLYTINSFTGETVFQDSGPTGKYALSFFQDQNHSLIIFCYPHMIIDVVDFDHDWMNDHWELKYDFDPNNPYDADGDNDIDLLINREEYYYGTNPYNNDTDSDGWTDYDEIYYLETDPTDSGDPPDYSTTTTNPYTTSTTNPYTGITQTSTYVIFTTNSLFQGILSYVQQNTGWVILATILFALYNIRIRSARR